MNYVVDTSALVRLYIDEDDPIPRGTREAIAAANQGKATVFVPATCVTEFYNVFVVKKEMMPEKAELSPADVDVILAGFGLLKLKVVPDDQLLGSATALARKWELFVYDALFMALAIREKAHLLTGDYELANAWEAYHGRVAREVKHKIRGKLKSKPLP